MPWVWCAVFLGHPVHDQFDHLINAISSWNISYLCLLDLSAAFITIDHDTLLTRLSCWFGSHGVALGLFMALCLWSQGLRRFLNRIIVIIIIIIGLLLLLLLLNWFRTYLSSRCFRVKCNNNLVSLHTCLSCFPRLSSWHSFSCISIIISRPSLVSSLSLNCRLYADDTQLFVSFHPSEFHSNITHLQNALQQISSWMRRSAHSHSAIAWLQT